MNLRKTTAENRSMNDHLETTTCTQQNTVTCGTSSALRSEVEFLDASPQQGLRPVGNHGSTSATQVSSFIYNGTEHRRSGLDPVNEIDASRIHDAHERINQMLKTLRSREKEEIARLKAKRDLASRRRRVRREICIFFLVFVLIYVMSGGFLLALLRYERNQPITPQGIMQDVSKVANDFNEALDMGVDAPLNLIKWLSMWEFGGGSVPAMPDEPQPVATPVSDPASQEQYQTFSRAPTDEHPYGKPVPYSGDAARFLFCKPGDAGRGYRPLRVCERLMVAAM